MSRLSVGYARNTELDRLYWQMGKAYCDKNLHIDMTDYQFIKNIYIAYLKSNKNDNLETKRQMRLYYNILKLHTLEELKKLSAYE